MSHIHVCLVSEQTVPNVLGIHHFKPDTVVFCTTKRMEDEGRTDAILDTLKLYGLDYSKTHHRFKVDQDCLEDCEQQLISEVYEKYKSDDLLVNLTGGTKIMVLAAYNVLKTAESVKMIYTPIPKNEYLEVYPRKGDCKTPQPYPLKLSVEAYVSAYGVKVKNSRKIEQLKTNAISNKDICEWIVKHYREVENLLAAFYENLAGHRDDKDFRLKMTYSPKQQSEKELLDKLGFKSGYIEKTLSKNEIRFLTGDWLSDFCFNEICKLEIDDCVTGIELVSPKGTDNEFDVMFTKDNALYIVECKSLKQKHDKDADILYKIRALQYDFGLRVNGFLVSTARTIISDKGEIRESVIKRAEQCKSKVIHPDKIEDFSAWIKDYVKGLNTI